MLLALYPDQIQAEEVPMSIHLRGRMTANMSRQQLILQECPCAVAETWHTSWNLQNICLFEWPHWDTASPSLVLYLLFNLKSGQFRSIQVNVLQYLFSNIWAGLGKAGSFHLHSSHFTMEMQGSHFKCKGINCFQLVNNKITFKSLHY